ncbi:Phosphopantetheine adenylyltransferase [Ruminococcaceae bacterium FB2012]|nr:Phosphopantetheine adenylyltransferase [Ruminococcaceae bacterium FB2012]
MRIAVVPGSFDPVTNGHLDIINRASKLFDKVIVLVSYNPNKQKARFSVKERLEMINAVIGDFDNVVADCNDGLLADYLERTGACAIVKGLRAVTDFEYEFQMALANRQLCSTAETVFLTTSPMNMYLSSSMVREIASLGGDINGFVPPAIRGVILERLSPNHGNIKK